MFKTKQKTDILSAIGLRAWKHRLGAPPTSGCCTALPITRIWEKYSPEKKLFSIPESLLLASQPHIFVEIQRFLFNTKGKRIVLSIAELGQKSDDFPMLDEIFCWNFETETLENTKPFDDLQSWNFLKKKSPQSHIKDLSEAHNFH